MMKIKHLLFYLLTFFVLSCANQKMPTGGARDDQEPFIVSTFPADSSFMNNGKIIKIVYNEQIEPNSKPGVGFIISPPTNFTISVKNKTATLLLKSPLKASTTYSLISNNAVKDITEGNESKSQSLLFSTGVDFDTFKLSGNVSIFKDQQVSSFRVALYPKKEWPQLDTILPDYITNVNELGVFEFKNIKPINYDVVLLTTPLNNFYWNKVSPIGIYKSTETNLAPITLQAFEPYPIRKNRKEPCYFLDQKLLAIPIDPNLYNLSNILINNKLYNKNGLYFNDTFWVSVEQEVAKNIVISALGDSLFLSSPKSIPKTSLYFVERIDNELIIYYKIAPKTQFDSFRFENSQLGEESPANNGSISFKIKPQFKDSVLKIKIKEGYIFTNQKNGEVKIISIPPNPATELKINIQFKSLNKTYFVLKQKTHNYISVLNNENTDLEIKLPKGDYSYYIFEDLDNNSIPTPGSWTSKKIPDPIYKGNNSIIVKSSWDMEIKLNQSDFD